MNDLPTKVMLGMSNHEFTGLHELFIVLLVLIRESVADKKINELIN